MTKDEYLEWRHHPCHEEFLKEMFDLIDVLMAELVNNAGENSAKDARLSGKIAGIKELVEWKPTIEEEETE